LGRFATTHAINHSLFTDSPSGKNPSCCSLLPYGREATGGRKSF
jgi:hypothetical protein